MIKELTESIDVVIKNFEQGECTAFEAAWALQYLAGEIAEELDNETTI